MDVHAERSAGESAGGESVLNLALVKVLVVDRASPSWICMLNSNVALVKVLQKWQYNSYFLGERPSLSALCILNPTYLLPRSRSDEGLGGAGWSDW